MPTIVDLPKRQRSGAFKFSDEDLQSTLKLLSEAKTGQAVIVTEAFKAKDYKPKDNLTAEQVARNVASGRNNTIRQAVEPHIDNGYYVKMHVIEHDGGYVGAVSLRKGDKPERKERKPTVRRKKNESLADYNKRREAKGLAKVES